MLALLVALGVDNFGSGLLPPLTLVYATREAGLPLAVAGVVAVALAVCLLAAGQQLFYSSLFALIADVAGDRPKDHPFAVVGMVRAACF
ncbi:MAG TPA: hypothetical protein VFU98_03395, partial [Microlunatus sp.]|nr:hypothetical protein [Microlunatus sp.]